MVQKIYAMHITWIYIYSRWRKIRGLDKDDSVENKGQIKSAFKEFTKKSNDEYKYFSLKELESPHYLQAILRNPPTHTSSIKYPPTHQSTHQSTHPGIYW